MLGFIHFPRSVVGSPAEAMPAARAATRTALAGRAVRRSERIMV
jgi:hypothetical protein